LSALQLEANVAENLLVAVCFAQIIGANHKLATREAHRKIDLHAFAVLRQLWLACFQCSDTFIDGGTLTHTRCSKAAQLLRSHVHPPPNAVQHDLLESFLSNVRVLVELLQPLRRHVQRVIAAPPDLALDVPHLAGRHDLPVAGDRDSLCVLGTGSRSSVWARE